MQPNLAAPERSRINFVVSADFHRRLKHLALKERTTLTMLIMTALKDYMSKGKKEAKSDGGN